MRRAVSRPPGPSTRAERVAFVERMRREIAEDDARQVPTTPAARKRVVEVLAIESGLPPPTWGGPPQSRRAEPIDDRPWRAERERAVRAQWNRLGRHGLAAARDGTLRCTRCKEVVLAVPRDRPFAMGAPVSALAMRHAEETGCR